MCVINGGTEGGCPNCNSTLANLMRASMTEFANWNNEYSRRVSLAHKTGVLTMPELNGRDLSAPAATSPLMGVLRNGPTPRDTAISNWMQPKE